MVYAGAIMVLFLFVIMLLNVKPRGGPAGRRAAAPCAESALALVTLLVLQVGAVLRALAGDRGARSFDASTRTMAQLPLLARTSSTSSRPPRS